MRELMRFVATIGSALLCFGFVSVTRLVHAAPATPSATNRVKAGSGQSRLELRRNGALVEAVVCPRGCDWSTAQRWTLPEPFAQVPATYAQLELAKGRYAGHWVIVAEERRFELVLAAPLLQQGKADAAGDPKTVVAFAGETGLTSGEAPDRSGQIVDVLPTDEGFVNVVVGQVREDVSLCGRQALLVPKLLHPQSLSLRRVRLQRLPQAERDAAPRLEALPIAGQVPSNVFTPLVASSAKGSPAVLTDNDVTTVWTENRGGNGSGEFVVMRAPGSIGLTGLVLTLPETPSASYAPPKSLWVVSDEGVFQVSLTPPAATTGFEVEGSTAPLPTEWHVAFPATLKTSCLAIALDTAFEPETTDGQSLDIDVGLAEIAATTDLDDARLNQALADLDSGGDRASAAEQMLAQVGRLAFAQVRKRYRSYSESGRMRALNVMDSAPCRVAVPVYVTALYNVAPAEGEHGAKRLAACKTQAVPALARRLPRAGSERSRVLASTLAKLDPTRAVEAIEPLLSGGSRAKRRVLRASFAAAAKDPNAAGRVRELLSDGQLKSKPGLEMMRALGGLLSKYREVAVPRLRDWLTATDFDTQYLLLTPAATLAPYDTTLQAYVLNRLAHATEPALRTLAARTTPANRQTAEALVAAVTDPHVRVREAAVTNLGKQAVSASRTALEERVLEDPWPLVRGAAVRALGELKPEPSTVEVLGNTVLEDDAPSVRRPALYVLGKLGATSQLPAVREVFEQDLDMHVRASAAATLGALCDRKMTNALADSALRLASASSSEAERVVGKASLSALGRLAPPDLKQRLAPYFTDGVPRQAQAAAGAALSHPQPCESAALGEMVQ